jgi:cytoskeletal protein RodZ
MTPFTPLSVINWYKARPKWLKILLALVLIIPLVLAAFWWFLDKVTMPSESDYTVIREKHDDERRAEAKERDNALAARIEQVKKSREEKQKAKQAIMEGNKESHEEIDNTDGIDAHIAEYNKGRRGRD